MAKKNDQGGSGYRSAPAQGTPVICSGCGQPTTVPFEPRGDRPVFCRDCYQARKGSGGAAVLADATVNSLKLRSDARFAHRTCSSSGKLKQSYPRRLDRLYPPPEVLAC